MPRTTTSAFGLGIASALLLGVVGQNLGSDPPAGADAQASSASDGKPPPAKYEDIFPYRLDRDRPRLAAGDEATAKEYYRDLAERLGFPGKEVPPLAGLLAYFGYTAITPADLDRLAPHEMMDEAFLKKRYADAAKPNEFSAGKWDVLSAGYFAPKTSDVFGRSNKLSWRKMIRLKPRAGSPAAQAGLTAMYFLSVI